MCAERDADRAWSSSPVGLPACWHAAMAKVEVQIRSCFCCGLSVATLFVALYTLILYSLLTGLAGYGLSDTASNGDSSYFRNCELEAQGRSPSENRKLTFSGGHTVVVIEDSSSYHCSLGLYTEEMKYAAETRYTTLVIDVVIYVAMVLASVLLLFGIWLYNQWLLVPWIIVMAIDIIRGFISVFFIFWFSYGNLARIATGIFFLGLQFFHISLLMIIIAKFQRIYNRKNGLPVDSSYNHRGYPPSSAYGYPDQRHAEYYPDPARDPYYGSPQHQQPYENHGYRY